MSRLIAFGCSFTVGLGLPDIYPPNTFYWKDLPPSKYAWPNLLGERLGREVINCGVAGAGNKEILSKILTFDFLPDDIVVVLWSAFDRHDMTFYNKELHNPMRLDIKHFLAVNDTASDKWKNHTRIKNWLTIHHASLYLQTKVKQSYTLLGILHSYDEFTKLDLEYPNLIEDINPHAWVVDEALDNEGPLTPHPGLESHRLLSNLLYDRIK